MVAERGIQDNKGVTVIFYISLENYNVILIFYNNGTTGNHKCLDRQ